MTTLLVEDDVIVTGLVIREMMTDPQWQEHQWVGFRVPSIIRQMPRTVKIGDTAWRLAGYVTCPGEEDQATYEVST